MQPASHHSPEVRQAAAGPALDSPVRETDPAVINPAKLAALEKKSGTTVRASKSELGEPRQHGPPPFVPLDLETRAAVDTATAAYHLNRQPQTLRGWACKEDGPVRPIRVFGRLAWPVAELRRVLEVAQ
jgi:hypothetical protein